MSLEDQDRDVALYRLADPEEVVAVLFLWRDDDSYVPRACLSGNGGPFMAPYGARPGKAPKQGRRGWSPGPRAVAPPGRRGVCAGSSTPRLGRSCLDRTYGAL